MIWSLALVSHWVPCVSQFGRSERGLVGMREQVYGSEKHWVALENYCAYPTLGERTPRLSCRYSLNFTQGNHHCCPVVLSTSQLVSKRFYQVKSEVEVDPLWSVQSLTTTYRSFLEVPSHCPPRPPLNPTRKGKVMKMGGKVISQILCLIF